MAKVSSRRPGKRRAGVASALSCQTTLWRYARVAKIVPSERLRRELDEVLAGIGEQGSPSAYVPDDVAENVAPNFRKDLAFTLRLLPGDLSSAAYDAKAYRGRVLATAADVLRGYGLRPGNWSQHQALRFAAGALAAAVALVA
jgi:hypothetical protein